MKRGTKPNERYSLAGVRGVLGKTQDELARRARLDQSQISTLEHRNDVKLTTLCRYAKALGGKIETAIVVGDERFVLDLPR